MTRVIVYLTVSYLVGLASTAPSPTLHLDCNIYRGLYTLRDNLSTPIKEKVAFCISMDLYVAAEIEETLRNNDIPAEQHDHLHCEQVVQPDKESTDTEKLIFKVCESYRVVNQTILRILGFNVDLLTSAWILPIQRT